MRSDYLKILDILMYILVGRTAYVQRSPTLHVADEGRILVGSSGGFLEALTEYMANG